MYHKRINSDICDFQLSAAWLASSRLAGKQYGQPFGIDITFGDPMFGEPDTVTADDVLGSAGIAPPVLQPYPIETHTAEKPHAYTMPRARLHTRVKDLPDIALLATLQRVDGPVSRGFRISVFSR